MADIRFRLYMEFSGRNQGWTEVTGDLHEPSGMDGGYGIRGFDPQDRVATTGVLSFTLNNSELNSASLRGYYTIGHVNQRTGFQVGIGVQVRLQITGYSEINLFTGEITDIEPTSGIRQQRLCRVTAVDYMDKCARAPLAGLGTFTNYALYSEQFDNAAWVKTRCSISADATTDPNLDTVADELIEDGTAASTHFVQQTVTITAGESCAIQVYAKANTRSWIMLQLFDAGGNGGYCYFDLTNGVKGAEANAGTGTLTATKITDAGDGWYKCSVVGTIDPAATSAYLQIYLATGSGVNSYNGDGASSVYLVRGQFERAVAFSSSPITTTSAAVTRNKGLEVLRNVREQDAFDLVADLLEVQPRSREAQSGFDTYDFCFDLSRDERDKVTTEFQRLALSSLGHIYANGSGGLVYETRQTRAIAGEAIINLTGADIVNSAPISVDDRSTEVLNRVTTVIAPRREETSNVIMWELNQPMPFGIGGPFQVKGLYTDPAQRAIRAGGLDMVEAVANTDYVFNTAADGTGTDVTASVTVSTTFTSNAVLFGIINNSGATAYATKLQARGLGVYAVEPAALLAEDTNHIGQWGEQATELEMPYQSDITTAQEVADWLLFIHVNEKKMVNSIPIFLNPSNLDRAYVLANRGISDRISVTEEMTGLSAANFFINAVDFRMDSNGHCWLFWTPAPADDSAFWYLEIVGFSEMGQTTRLGFGYLVGHTDVDHSDFHTDTAHGDTAHTDTHTDTAHGDDAHGDSTHTDSHGDTAHSDSHNDTAHGDVSHADVAHSDSHSDTAHGDVAHDDTAHSDTHTDTAHADAHTDTAHDDSHDDSHDDHDDTFPLHTDEHEDTHNDTAHDDTHSDTGHGDSHSDLAHGDDHTDDAHSDTHNDTAHSDSHTDDAHADTHTDVSHDDSHGDGSHTDTGHVDTAHDDTHSDVSHADSVYIDEHGDTAHGDAN